MGSIDPVVVQKKIEDELMKEEKKEKRKENEEIKDLEKGEINSNIHYNEGSVQIHPSNEIQNSRMQNLSYTNPLLLVIDNATRIVSPSPSPSPHNLQQPQSTSTPQQPVLTLNSRKYTDKMSLFLFLLHIILAFGLVGFLIFKGVQGLLEEGKAQRKEKRVLKYFLPQVEAASFLSITLAFLWQKLLTLWPKFMVHFIIWSSFISTLSAGILLICYQTPATYGIGAVFIAFAIGNALYVCRVTQRTNFCSKIFIKLLEPISKFSDINHPTYWMLGFGFIWMSFWILAIIGALNFYTPPLIIIALVLSLVWTCEVMTNVANLTVSRVIALYYMRGMQSSTRFCFIRALSTNLGSACLGSLLMPAIGALRIMARGLNLLEGEDVFMFCCAHYCLRVMESIFKRGNGWAYVQIAAYGKGFIKASQDTWELFEKREMEQIVNYDMTSAICFLTGVCSGSICTIVVVVWTAHVHRGYIGTLAVLATFIGCLMTRIAMALPRACVSCYYICYAENPDNRLFDKTIPDQIEVLKSGRKEVMLIPRVPYGFTR